MSSGINRFSEAETVVFWNLDKCPIPKNLSPVSISDNIKLALKNIGYNGQLSINAYTDTEQIDKDFESAGIKLIKTNPGSSVGLVMTVAVYSWWGEKERREPKNLLVISGVDVYMFVDFDHMNMNDNNLLLAHPPQYTEEIPCLASSIWLWDSLSSGGSPFHNKTVSLRKATPSPKPCNKFLTAETVVFWNLDLCPIPNDLSPASIHANIKLALKNLGYTGKVSISAYTQGKHIKKEFEMVGINLIELDSVINAGVMVQHHAYGQWWELVKPYEPKNLLVIAREDVDMYYGFIHGKNNYNNLFLAHPQYTSEEIPCTATSIWLWDSLSRGGSPFHNRTPSPTTGAVTTDISWDQSRKSSPHIANKKMKRPRMKPCNKFFTFLSKKKPCNKKRKSRATHSTD